jgi:hypothetical protein
MSEPVASVQNTEAGRTKCAENLSVSLEGRGEISGSFACASRNVTGGGGQVPGGNMCAENQSLSLVRRGGTSGRTTGVWQQVPGGEGEMLKKCMPLENRAENIDWVKHEVADLAQHGDDWDKQID